MNATERKALATALIGGLRVQGVDTAGVIAVLDRLQDEVFEPGDRIYGEGDRSEYLHVLMEGSVRVVVAPDDHELTRVRAPAVIGHLGVLSGLKRSATVLAAGRVRVGRLSYQDLWSVAGESGAAGAALRRVLLASLAKLIADTNSRLMDLVGDHGSPIPEDAPRIAPKRVARKPPRRAADEADALTSGFDADLLREAENVSVVETEAARREKYKR